MQIQERDMPNNLHFKEVSTDKYIWIPEPTDSLDDLVKENGLNRKYLQIKGHPHIENWEELILEIQRRETPPVDTNTNLSKSDRRKAYFSEVRLRQWTWFGISAAVIFVIVMYIVFSVLMDYFPNGYKVYAVLFVLAFAYALSIPSTFAEISNCMRIETGFIKRLGVRRITRLPMAEIRRINKRRLKIQKRLGIVLTDEEMEEWSKYI